MHFPTDRTAKTTTFDEPVVDHWLEWKIAQLQMQPPCRIDLPCRRIQTFTAECSTAYRTSRHPSHWPLMHVCSNTCRVTRDNTWVVCSLLCDLLTVSQSLIILQLIKSIHFPYLHIYACLYIRLSLPTAYYVPFLHTNIYYGVGSNRPDNSQSGPVYPILLGLHYVSHHSEQTSISQGLRKRFTKLQ